MIAGGDCSPTVSSQTVSRPWMRAIRSRCSARTRHTHNKTSWSRYPAVSFSRPSCSKNQTYIPAREIQVSIQTPHTPSTTPRRRSCVCGSGEIRISIDGETRPTASKPRHSQSRTTVPYYGYMLFGPDASEKDPHPPFFGNYFPG